MKNLRLLAAVVAAVLSDRAMAAVLYLDTAPATTSWGAAGSWTTDPTTADVNAGNSIPTATDTATFNTTALNTTAANVTLDGPQAAQGLVFNTTAATGGTPAGTSAITAGTGGANTVLTLGSGGITLAIPATAAGTNGSVTIGSGTPAQNVAVQLNGNQTWANNYTGTGTPVLTVAGPVSAANAGATTLTLAATSTSSSTNLISGPISDGSGVVSIAVSSSNNNGRWTVSGNNTYTGTTTVSSGALTIGSTTALGGNLAGQGTLVGNNGGLFFRAAIGTINEPLTLAGTGPASTLGALRNVAGDNAWAGPISATTATANVAIGADANTLTITGDITTSASGTGALVFTGNGAASGSFLVSGNISGAAGVTKSGSSSTTSVLTFGTVAKTYSGPTVVSTNVLALNVALPNTSGLTVAAGATLRGNGGSVNAAATTTVNGTISPGASASPSIGTLGTGPLTLGALATFALDINSGGAVTKDLVNVTGNLTLTSGNALTVADAGSTVLPVGTAVSFIDYSGTWNTGTLFSVAGTPITDNGNTFAAGANLYQIDYDFGGANGAVALIAAGAASVPEPASAVLLGGLVLAGLARRRQRR